MRYQDLISEESGTPEFSGSFPTIMAAIEERAPGRVIKFKQAIDLVKTSVDNGEIISTELNDLRSFLNRIVELAFETLISQKYHWSKEWRGNGDELNGLFADFYVNDVRGVKTLSKKLAKIPPTAHHMSVYRDMKSFVDEAMPLADSLEWLKGHVVSAAARKKEVAVAKKEASDSFMKNLVNSGDAKRVIALLTVKSAEKRQEVFDNELAFFVGKVEKFKKEHIRGKRDWQTIFENDPMGSFIISRVIDASGDLRGDYLDDVSKMVKDAVDAIVDGFVYKNTSKIAFVLSTKNNLDTVELLNIDIKQGAVTCDIVCKFEDGSRFTATSSVVMSVSSKGNPFYRYPTTFHNVILPDGKKLLNPSEQRMEEIFAVA